MSVEGQISFSHFVFPFSFDQSIFFQLLSSVETLAWAGKNGQFPVWHKAKFPSDELLPHVSRYLNPETEIPTAGIYSMSEQALVSRELGHICHYGDSKFRWMLKTKAGNIGFYVRNIRLCLFQTGIGFLLVNAVPKENRSEVDTWQNFLHYFRFIKGQRGVRIQGMACQTDDPSANWKPNFPGLSENEEFRSTGIGKFYDILQICLRSICPGSDWWEELFIDGQLLPYAGIFLEDIPEQEIPIILYKFQNFHHAKQLLDPSVEHLNLCSTSILPYSHLQWFTYSLEGGTFLSFTKLETTFNRATLPDHLNRHYFLVYILALHQRFSLMKFSEMIARQWVKNDDLSDEEQEAAFERIQEAMLSFMARGYFAQVMQREHHHRCFMKWQETLQIERLFRDVDHMISEMHRYLEARKSRRIQELTEIQNQQIRQEAEADALKEKEAQIRANKLERRVSILALILGLPALALTFLQSSQLENLQNSLLTLVLSSIIAVVTYRLLVGRK